MQANVQQVTPSKASAEVELNSALEIMMNYQSFASSKIKQLSSEIQLLGKNLEQPYVKNKE